MSSIDTITAYSNRTMVIHMLNIASTA